MTQPYVLQRLAERVYWVQSFNYGTVFYVGDHGVLIFDTLEGVYDNIAAAVASVTDKPITGAIYPHYHADHIGDIEKYVTAAEQAGQPLRIFGSEKSRQAMELSNSSFPAITDVVGWPQGSFTFEDLTDRRTSTPAHQSPPLTRTSEPDFAAAPADILLALRAEQHQRPPPDDSGNGL